MFEHSIAFDRPAYLALLALVPVMWWLGYRSLAGLGRWRRWMALTLRTLVMILVIFALADVQYQRRSEGLTVVYLLDQSLSVPVAQRGEMIDYVRNSIKQHRDSSRGDRFAVIVFGRDAEVEIPPVAVNDALHGKVESVLDPEYTDLATAIQRAKAIFPYDTAKRIVLVTDGNQNVGNGYREARTAADAGVSIDVVPVYLEPSGEVAVDPALQGVDCGSLDAQGLATQFQSAFRRKTMGAWAWDHGQPTVMMAQVYLNRETPLERTIPRPPAVRCLGFCRGDLPPFQPAAGPWLPVGRQPDWPARL